MAFQNILYEQNGPIVTITVHRPDKLNALNQQTISELQEAFENAQSSREIRTVILTGSGEKAFVAGADIGEIHDLTPTTALAFSQAGHRLMQTIENLGKPVIAAVNGYALGGGCELALACSIRIAGSNAKMGLPEISLGIMPGFGGTQRMPRLVGRAAALELSLTGKPMNAERALALGLVSQVVDPDQLKETVTAMANQLAHSAPIAITHILNAVQLGTETSMERGLEYEAQLFALCCATADMKEGTDAFLNKRAPSFSGK